MPANATSCWLARPIGHLHALGASAPPMGGGQPREQLPKRWTKQNSALPLLHTYSSSRRVINHKRPPDQRSPLCGRETTLYDCSRFDPPECLVIVLMLRDGQRLAAGEKRPEAARARSGLRLNVGLVTDFLITALRNICRAQYS